MADKFNDPFEIMDELEAERPATRPRVPPKRKYDDPMEEISRRAAAQVTAKESLIAGQYVRRTFTFLPGQLDMVADVAEDLGMSQNAAARWLLDVGLLAYVNGARPEVEEKPIRVEPKLEQW
jgi:hypothetical protein